MGFLAMWSAYTVIVLRIVSCIRICRELGFVCGASEEFVKPLRQGSEHQMFVVCDATVVGNHRGQYLNQLYEMDEICRLEEIGNDASVRCLADDVETIAPTGVFTAKFPDGREQRPGSDDFYRLWIASLKMLWIRCRLHVTVCHLLAIELVVKRRHGEICSSLHACLSKRLLQIVVHPSLSESDIDVAVDDIDRVWKRSFLKPLRRILHEVVVVQFDEGMVSED